MRHFLVVIFHLHKSLFFLKHIFSFKQGICFKQSFRKMN
ncbi:hypothetical protein yaldo0001_39300 [Yersinia aldovae ATCC 35236]|nr:hypothetical protein yaldo0001_39300 [Yersinia aldovae ATCC 35236]